MLERRADEDVPLLLGSDIARVGPVEDAPELGEAVLDRCAREAVAELGGELVEGFGRLALGVLDAVGFVDKDERKVAGREGLDVVATSFDAAEDCAGRSQWEPSREEKTRGSLRSLEEREVSEGSTGRGPGVLTSTRC